MTSPRLLRHWITWIKYSVTRRPPLMPVILWTRWLIGIPYLLTNPALIPFSLTSSSSSDCNSIGNSIIISLFSGFCVRLFIGRRTVCIPPPPSVAEWEEDQLLQQQQQQQQKEDQKKEEATKGEQSEQQPQGQDGTEVTSPTRLQIADLPPVSEVDARNALLSMVTEHCCWGRAAARHMSIGKILSSSAFHVMLSQFQFETHMRLHLAGDFNLISKFPLLAVL